MEIRPDWYIYIYVCVCVCVCVCMLKSIGSKLLLRQVLLKTMERLGRRYGKFLYHQDSDTRKITRKLEKLISKSNKFCSIVFIKTCLYIYIYIYTSSSSSSSSSSAASTDFHDSPVPFVSIINRFRQVF